MIFFNIRDLFVLWELMVNNIFYGPKGLALIILTFGRPLLIAYTRTLYVVNELVTSTVLWISCDHHSQNLKYNLVYFYFLYLQKN